ncbi:hypothetical protein ACFSC4_14235 [Deinococcus malanensis]|uniref:hypothetical protein n=1 Tax=Deinococcus malanensis TaxID=1706855 RepID=UPI00363AE3E3
MRRILPALTVSAALLGGAAFAAAPAAVPAAGCTPAQDQEAARVAAISTARGRLDVAAFFYRLQYNDVAYDVKVQDAEVAGNSATVRGLLTLRATQRRDGKAIGATYQGWCTSSAPVLAAGLPPATSRKAPSRASDTA